MKLTLIEAIKTLENRGFTVKSEYVTPTFMNGSVTATVSLDAAKNGYVVLEANGKPEIALSSSELTNVLDRLFTPEGVPYASLSEEELAREYSELTDAEENRLKTTGNPFLEGKDAERVSEGLAEIRSIFESESLPLADLDFIEAKAALIQGETARAIVDKFRSGFDSAEEGSYEVFTPKDDSEAEKTRVEANLRAEEVDALRIRKPEGRSALKPFGRSEWSSLAGAERFPDGSEPLYATLVNDTVMLIVDASGLEIAINEDESRYRLSIARPYVTKKVVIAIAEGIIREVMETTLNSTILEAYGFVRT